MTYLCAVQSATRLLWVLTLLFLLGTACSAQKIQKDSTTYRRLNPRKATILSAVCPGLGQIYNGKIWKSAVLYAGMAGIAYGYVYNQNEFKSYQHAVDVRFDTLSSTIDTKYPSLSDGTVQSNRDFHRRNRDICILAFVGLYALNIIDANVDAHLQEFKINRDLTLRWNPEFRMASGTTVTGIRMQLNF